MLITLDGAHDAAANREYLAREQIDYLIKWNPRKENPNDWKVRAESGGAALSKCAQASGWRMFERSG